VARLSDVRRIALSLPEASEGEGPQVGFSVRNGTKDKGFCWVWMERVDPKKARVPQPKVLAVRVVDAGEKQMLIEADPEKFFTEPHYNGFPAVLVRLPAIGTKELRELITDGWRCLAPRALVAEFDARQATRSPRQKR
jgi:hypothetical protein